MGLGLRSCGGTTCLEVVTPAIGVDDGLLAFNTLLAVAMLHAQDAGEALLVDVLEDVAIVDFAGGWVKSFQATSVLRDTRAK